MGIHHFELFVVATFLLNITPGNDFLYVATRSLGQGMKAGIISAFGISTGLLVHISASVLGLSAFLAQSALAFEIVKFAGAGYLIWLGVRMFFSTSQDLTRMDCWAVDNTSLFVAFRQGFITNVFNPKVVLFFLSFLPQFADAHSPNFSVQLLFLGLWFIFSGTVVNIGVVFFFGKMRTWFLRFPIVWKWQQKVVSFLLIGLGLKIAFETSSSR